MNECGDCPNVGKEASSGVCIACKQACREYKSTNMLYAMGQATDIELKAAQEELIKNAPYSKLAKEVQPKGNN